MSLVIDRSRFRRILDTTAYEEGGPVSEIHALVAITELAANVDLRDTPEKELVVDALAVRLCELGGVLREDLRPLSPIPIDAEERRACISNLAASLESRPARELAYALAYLVVVADQELAPLESTLLDELRQSFAISRERANELSEASARTVTPRERDTARIA